MTITSTQLETSNRSKMSLNGSKMSTSPPVTKEAPAGFSTDITSNSHPVTADIEPSSSQTLPSSVLGDGRPTSPRLLRRDDVEELPINERTCLLQNYGILLESGVQGLGNGNSVKVFDYSVEHLDDGHSHQKDGNQEMTKRETDKQSEASLESFVELDSFRELWHNPDPKNDSLIYLRVMDFSNVENAAQGFLPNAKKMLQQEMESNIYRMLYDKNKKSIVTKDPEFIDDLEAPSNSDSKKGKDVGKPTGDSHRNSWDYSEITIKDQNADPELVKNAKKIAEEEMKRFSKILMPANLPTLKSSTPVFFNCSDEGQALVLGVSLPYFSLGTSIKSDMPESFSLPEYMSLGRDKNKLDNPVSLSSETKEARVHKALLMVINNEMIAIFRSKEDGQPGRPPPLFQYQERHGAYRSLVTIISNVLKCPQKKIFNFFEDKLCEQQYIVTRRMSSLTSTDDISIISNLERLNTDISALNIGVKSQIEILKELRQIYENTFYQENTYDRNSMKIPMLWEMKEQIRPALPTIDKIIGERKLFYENLKDLVKGVRKLQKSFCSFIEVEMAMNTTKGVQDAIQEIGNKRIPDQTITIVHAIENQTKEAGGHTGAVIYQNRIIQKQARVMTALMFITMVFLPLSFFASYLGMNEGWVHRAKSEHTIFWAISAPVTLVIGILTCWFDHVYEDWPQKWKELTTGKKSEADIEKAAIETCYGTANATPTP